MVESTGLNNRVYHMLSQKSSKAAVDVLGMRLSTNYKNKFTEIMITETEAFGRQGSCEAILIRSGLVLLGKNYVESRRKVKMKSNKVTGPGNITKGLGLDLLNDGEDLFTGSLNLAPRIHPVDRAVATQRKNAKSKDKNLWRFTLVQK